MINSFKRLKKIVRLSSFSSTLVNFFSMVFLLVKYWSTCKWQLGWSDLSSKISTKHMGDTSNNYSSKSEQLHALIFFLFCFWTSELWMNLCILWENHPGRQRCILASVLKQVWWFIWLFLAKVANHYYIVLTVFKK